MTSGFNWNNRKRQKKRERGKTFIDFSFGFRNLEDIYHTLDQKQINARQKDKDLHVVVSKVWSGTKCISIKLTCQELTIGPDKMRYKPKWIQIWTDYQETQMEIIIVSGWEINVWEILDKILKPCRECKKRLGRIQSGEKRRTLRQSCLFHPIRCDRELSRKDNKITHVNKEANQLCYSTRSNPCQNPCHLNPRQ